MNITTDASIALVSCECEHADHFDHATDAVTILNGPCHDYLMKVEPRELTPWRSMFGSFALCTSCRAQHADPTYAAEGGEA